MTISKIDLPSQVKNTQITFPQFSALFKNFKLSSFLKDSNITKEAGTSVFEILSVLFCIICKRSQSISEGLKLLKVSSQKSTYYDFLSKEQYDWRKSLQSLAKLYSNMFPPDEGKPSFLAIDDTANPKTGKFVEHISSFYDHSKKVYFKGYQFVLAVLCNCRTTIPVDFVLKTSSTKSKKSKRKKKLKNNRVINPNKRWKTMDNGTRYKSVTIGVTDKSTKKKITTCKFPLYSTIYQDICISPNSI